MKPTTFFATLLLVVSSVKAHGYVAFFDVDGTTYAGNEPGGSTSPSPIRQISTISPVKGSSNTNLMCGQDAASASMVVDAMPGSKITFQWSGGQGGNWPHNTGPLLTYMASCGSTTCDKFDSTSAKWFKIDQVGTKAGDANTWVQADIMAQMSYTTKIPDSLASGQYLIRHEIIALQLAVSEGGAEFYPSCTQVKVGGSQVSTASSSELVSFPGAYADTDPGIFDPNVYNPDSSYTFPGPSVAQMASGDSSVDTTGPRITSANSSGSGSGSSSAGVPASSSTPGSQSSSAPVPSSSAGGGSTGSSGSGQCRLSKGRTMAKRNKVTADARAFKPRHLSRIMARLFQSSRW